MDPVTQTLAQQQSGSAGGQGFAQFFVEGRRHAQNQQQLNLSQRRLELEEQQQQRLDRRDSLLLPIEANMMQAQVAGMGIQAQLELEKTMSNLHMNAALPDIYQLEQAFARSQEGFGDRELIDATMTMARKFPRAFAPGMPGGDLLVNIRSVPMLQQQFRQVEEALKRFGEAAPEGAIPQSVDLKSGRVTFMNEPRSANMPAAVIEAKQVTDLRRKISAEQDPTKRQDLELELNDLLTQTSPAGTTTEVMGPDGNILMRTSTGKNQNPGPPIQVRTKAEAVANKAASLISIGNQIIDLAKPGNVGAEGNLKRLGKEIAGQFMDVEAGEEFDFAQATTFFKADAAQMLKSDSQITDAERKSIIKDLPGKGFIESDETAKKKAKLAIRKVAESARRQIVRAGVELPTQLMTPDEIIDKAAKGEIPEDEAVKMVQRSPFTE